MYTTNNRPTCVGYVFEGFHDMMGSESTVLVLFTLSLKLVHQLQGQMDQ
jgi:hypothetical protein